MVNFGLDNRLVGEEAGTVFWKNVLDPRAHVGVVCNGVPREKFDYIRADIAEVYKADIEWPHIPVMCMRRRARIKDSDVESGYGTEARKLLSGKAYGNRKKEKA